VPRARFDAFISHSGKNTAQAETIEAGLGAKRVWLDRSEIRLGALLGRELLANIRASRGLVLVWSKHAAQSPWVQSEWIAAANLGKPIVPVRLDKTPLPQSLGNTLWRQGGGASLEGFVDELARTIRGGLSLGPSISPSMRLPNPRLEAEVTRLALAQRTMFDDFYGGSPLGFGDYSVTVHHTPGHCPGGVCLRIERSAGDGPRHLFVGDTLFAGSIGRTDLPGGDYQVLLQSITGVLFPLGDDAVVHPGHGPDTTIGRERQTNPFVLEYVRSR